jgi:hypothetical protein
MEVPHTYLQEVVDHLCHLCRHQVDLEEVDPAGADLAEVGL